MYYLDKKQKKSTQGYITVSVIVFSAVFALILGGLIGFVFTQNRGQILRQNRERALQIAEAGLDYYKWYLAHFPNDLTHGTGQPGPYEIPYYDPEGGQIGAFSLEVEGETFCQETNVIEITSTGWTLDDPSATRVVYGKYAKPSVADYSFIINSNVWAGADREITGPYHSNGGIRMDGTNHSLVTTAVEDWQCTSSFGCNPTQTQDGVFGAGPNAHLWQFPVPQVDFAGLTLDLINLKDLAQNEGGRYFGPTTGSGYRVIFDADGTFDVYRVNSTNYVWGYTNEEGWHRNYHIIVSQSSVALDQSIDTNCPVLFFEDDVWVEGTVDGKVSVISADVTNPNIDTTVVLNNSIEYEDDSGSHGLTVVAENDVLIPLLSPNDMVLDGIFIAQKGRFGRNHYRTWGAYDVPWYYNSYVIRNQLDIQGTIVSNGRVGTRWTSGGSTSSGYPNRTATFDNNLADSPPPLTPTFSDEFTFVEWLEIQ